MSVALFNLVLVVVRDRLVRVRQLGVSVMAKTNTGEGQRDEEEDHEEDKEAAAYQVRQRFVALSFGCGRCSGDDIQHFSPLVQKSMPVKPALIEYTLCYRPKVLQRTGRSIVSWLEAAIQVSSAPDYPTLGIFRCILRFTYMGPGYI